VRGRYDYTSVENAPFLPICLPRWWDYSQAMQNRKADYIRNAVKPCSCFPKALNPKTEWLLASGDSIRQFRGQKNLELLICASASQSSNETTSTCSCYNSRKEPCIKKGFDHSTVIYCTWTFQRYRSSLRTNTHSNQKRPLRKDIKRKLLKTSQKRKVTLAP